MLPDNDRLAYLFDKYLHESASREELDELFACIRTAKQDELMKEQITNVFRQVQSISGSEQVDWDAMFSRVINGSLVVESKAPVKKLRVWRSVAAAVLILILGGAGAYLYFNGNSSQEDMVQSQNVQNDILPGGNKAILTLANGATVRLDSKHNGKLASQGNINVIKTGSGLLAYSRRDATANASTSDKRNRQPPGHSAMQYNTLTTPRGGQYRLTLSDGTKVWLNAASSIRYPVAFAGKERKVEITGEAYFEVVYNKKMPFRVQVGSEVIEDLGTHFNVNAYADEPVMRTTLLEGMVSVGNTILRPGEQAVVRKAGQITVVKDVDVANAIAWKDGFFAFNNANLQMVMRKLSRWYDITVEYQPGVNNEQRFSGKIDRNLTLSQILNGLKQTRAHFRIEADRKVVILP